MLWLIDGYALIYRAFFAMIARPLTTSRGENTSAAWGVANFLLRMRDEHQPEYVAWVNDAGSSFRKETFPEYKATREKLDEELQDTFDRSVQRIEELLAAFNVPLITVDGYEADDVIGTLADAAADDGLHAVIVSGDKDFYQLISADISLLNPGRGGPAAVSEELVTVENASDRLGVPPERVIDYLALVGDSSDNVPGVKGVGDKTARKLIEEFGDLDAILQHASEVSGKRAREALLAEAGNALLSRELVTIQRDVPVGISVTDLAAREPDPSALRAIFTELEFHSLVDRVGESGVGELPALFEPTIVREVREAVGVVERLRQSEWVGVRAIGSDPDPLRGELVGLALSTGEEHWYFPLGSGNKELDLLSDNNDHGLPVITDARLAPLAELLQDAAVGKAGHNIKRDGLVLRQAGVELRGISYDSMLASFLLDPSKRSHALEVLANDHFGEQIPSFADVIGRGKKQRSFADVPVEEAARYTGMGAWLALRLRDQFAGPLEQTGLVRLLNEIELPLVPVLLEMEWRGIKLDTEKLAELATEFRRTVEELEERIHEEAGTDFNINSTPQLRHVLFEKLQLPVIKKTKTGASTDAEVLAALAAQGYEAPKLLLEYRELVKLISTYVEALPRYVNPRTRRVHTDFNQTGAATGRLSSSDPNLQNIPVRTDRGGQIRRCFVPARGCLFVVADYSQIELRVLAHLSDDPAFIAAFQRGGDIHRETAAIIFDVSLEDVTAEMRARAKTINFATIYGQGPFALANQLEISREEAKEFIATYFERFAGVRAFLDETIDRARERGYVQTLFGRRRYIPELREKNFNIRSFGERTAMNSPIQGSAADLIKIAMRDLQAAFMEGGLRSGMLLQVHDELVIEAPDAEVETVKSVVREKMEGAAALKVPLVVDVGVGPNWLDAKQ